MKKPSILIAGLAVIFCLVSCPLQPPVAPVSVPDDAATSPVVLIDPARDLAVFVDADGSRTDVVAVDDDGAVVACVEPSTLTLVEPATVPGDGPEERRAGPLAVVRAIVTGRHADGGPGIWVVMSDRTVAPAYLEGDGRGGFRLPECDDRDGYLRGRWGWTYTITGKATGDDVTIVVGDAVNKNGFGRGPWKIEPGTSVGVYWKVVLGPGRHRVMVSPARVIGTLDPSRFPPWRDREEGRSDRRRHRGFELQRLFFLGWYDVYLTSTRVDGTSWDASNRVFVVEGTDQDGVDAVATIDLAGGITITPSEPPVDLPDLEVAAITVPAGAVSKSYAWPLEAVVRNAGAASAAESTVAFYVSGDATLDPSADTFLGTVTVPALAPAAEATARWSAAYSVGAVGTHWLFAVADSGTAVAESDETDNVRGAAVPVLYDRLIVDTYRPKTGVIVANTFASLFGSAGDTTRETGTGLWNRDVAPFTVDAPPISIAEADDGNPSFGSARIDFEGGIAPGTYYVRVRAQRSTMSGVYAIRVLLAPDEDYTAWYFGGTSDDSAYETDDNPPSGGVPTRPVTIGIGGKLNRALTAGDVDWFVLTLP